ncbi:MAG: methyltransferase [Eubacteriales bacterium]|nr:methyltransferase [Eubacteriales bacterium]
MEYTNNTGNKQNIVLNADESLTGINDSLRLIQKKDGLTFGTDALLLAAFIRPQRFSSAADLGSGTGVISLLCARRGKFAKINAVELQPDYADIISRNARLNNLEDVIIPVCDDVRNLSKTMTVDAAFSNPPYLKDNSGKPNENTGRNLARREINGDIGDFCASAATILKYGGLFYVVYRPDRMIDLLCSLRANNLEPKRLVMVYPDISSDPCLILAEAKKGANPSLITPRPLFLNIHGETSAEARHIYKTGDWFN